MNKGFGGGVNCGLRFAVQNGYDYAVLLNNDLFVSDASVFSDCVRVCRSNPQIGCVGVEHRRSDGSRESLGGGVVLPLLVGGVSKSKFSILPEETWLYHGVFFFLP